MSKIYLYTYIADIIYRKKIINEYRNTWTIIVPRSHNRSSCSYPLIYIFQNTGNGIKDATRE